MLAYKYVDACVEERMKAHARVGKRFLQYTAIEIVEVEDSHLAAKRAHVVDNLRRRGLAHGELELLVIACLDHIDERLHREGVMLCRDGKARLRSLIALIARFKHVCLLDHLACVAQKLGAVGGEHDAAAAAREDRYSQLSFERFDGARDVRLSGIKVLSCGVNGAALGYRDEEAQLLQSHGNPFARIVIYYNDN